MPLSATSQGVLRATARALRVLLVDDDPVNCEIGEAMLSRLGHRAVIATDGASAVEQARRAAFDVILMDLHMPDIDGVEAAARIRQLRLQQTPRIIAVTADVSRNARERLAGAGISKIVGKPILIKNLRDALEDDPQEGSETARLTAGTLIDERFLSDQKALLGAQQTGRLCELLEETSETLVADIIRAAAADDRAQLAKCAHRLGSAASALGLVRLFEACNAIELAAASMSIVECRTAARELDTLRQASLHALAGLIRPEGSRLLRPGPGGPKRGPPTRAGRIFKGGSALDKGALCNLGDSIGNSKIV